jgi:quinolinate synthase
MAGRSVLLTERLVLRPFRKDDAEAMFLNWTSDENVARYCRWYAHENISITEKLLKMYIDDAASETSYRWAITLNGHDEPIGCIDVVQFRENSVPEVGYVLSRRHWGQGLMTEALGAVTEELFRCGFSKIFACHAVDNPASGRVMEKCGMVYTHREWIQKKFNSDELCEVKCYGIEKSSRKKENPMTVRELQDNILKLKKETNTAILAHCYQAREITEIADFVGDSYKLSVDAKGVSADNILFCGVHFMAETAKMLSPQKRVYLAAKNAGCPMAEQMEPEMIKALREAEPDRKVVAYINTTAALKTVCDVCVTSSSALKIVRAMDCDKLLFIPDCNLGDYIRQQCPEKDIKLLNGGCPTHARVTVKEVQTAKAEHPEALFLVHPECTPKVVALADYVGSTTGIMDFAKKSDAKEFIIGTENSIVEHLQYDCPEKKFYPVTKDLVCHNMKLTTLPDVYNSLLSIAGRGGESFEIIMDDELIGSARKCIDEMIRLGG